MNRVPPGADPFVATTTRKLRLSDAGDQVLRHSREMLQALDAAVAVAGMQDAVPTGGLRITAHRVRPVLDDGQRVIVGFSVERYLALK